MRNAHPTNLMVLCNLHGNMPYPRQEGTFWQTMQGRICLSATPNSTVPGGWFLSKPRLGIQRNVVNRGGANPNGYLIFGSDGRMIVLVTATAREPGNTDEKLAALFRTLMAYSGRYRIDEDRFITKIDSSCNEAWNGSEQERFYKLDGDTLHVFTAWMPNPGNPIGRGILSFRRD